MSLFFRAARTALCVALGAGVGGCVSEAERREASRVRRPVMPAMAPGPAAPVVGEAEPATLAAAIAVARTGDFAAARRTLDTVADRDARARVVTGVAVALAATDPAAAAAFARALPPGLAQTAALEVAARAMVRRNGDSALRWAVEYSDPAAAISVRRTVADELVRVDPSATVRRLLALPGGVARDETLGFAAAAWARHDVSGADVWLRELPDDELRQRLIASAGFEVALTNPPRAVAFAELLPPGRNRWLLHAAVAQTWVAVDATAAFAWTRQLPAGAPREAAEAGLEAGLGIAVARRMVSSPDTRAGSSGRRAGGTVATERLGNESPAFAAWLATQRPGMSGDEAILEYVRQRGALEPFAVGPWVEALPGGPTRDRALELFLENLLRSSPAEAARWLRALPRSDRTDEQLERTAREWLRTNPDAAAAWLRASGLSPDRIEWLLQQAGRR